MSSGNKKSLEEIRDEQRKVKSLREYSVNYVGEKVDDILMRLSAIEKTIKESTKKRGRDTTLAFGVSVGLSSLAMGMGILASSFAKPVGAFLIGVGILTNVGYYVWWKHCRH